MSGSGNSVGAFLPEASGDLLTVVLVLDLEALDLIEGVFEAPFQRFGGGTLGGGDGHCFRAWVAEAVDLGAYIWLAVEPGP